MILIIKQGNGEQYEDYYEHIAGVYQINRKGLTSDAIENAYRSHIVKLCTKQGLIINPHWLNLMEKRQQLNGKITSAMKSLHKRILRENTIHSFVLSNYKAKQLNDIHEITNY